ncbi:MAG: transposase [Clostridia bacterium]|nr:transposase [Clostridia bacterium]
MNEIKTGREIILFDRGYPSSELIGELEKNNIKYVMRCSSVFTKGLKKKLTDNDCVITHKFEKTKIKITMRIVSFPISGKNTEMIVTNIFDKEFKPEDFKILYNMHWGIEKTYNCVNNMFCLESFTGSLPDTVLQDFYAVLFLYNAASVIVFENEKKLSEKYKERSNKLKYKTNVKMTVVKLKDILIKSLLSNSSKKRNRLFDVLSRQLERETIPIRDNRSYERKIKHTKHKFSQNQKL